MSNKRSKRNNNKVLKALRQKRANGGRLKAFAGININPADIQRAIAAQNRKNEERPAQPVTTQPSGEGGGSVTVGQAPPQSVEAAPAKDTGSVTVTNPPATTTASTQTAEDFDPKPVRSDFGTQTTGRQGLNQKKAYENALVAWEARNLDVTESSGSATETADNTAPQQGQGNNMSTSTTDGPPQVEITPPDLFEIDEVETQDVDLEGTALGAAQQIGAQKDVKASTVGKAPTVKTTKADTTKADIPTDVTAATMDAAKAENLAATQAAQGTLSPEAQAEAAQATLTERATAAQRDTAQEQAALAEEQDFDISDGAYVNKVTGQTTDVAPTREAEAKQREAITGKPAEDGQAAQIIGTVGYEAAQRRTVKGEAAKGAAASMIAEVGDLPPTITAAIVEDPASVEAQIDDQPVEVRAAIAALPTEALVSSQMETLLGGMEEGKTPAWARPAVAAIEANLAQRGLSASTVGHRS